MFQRRPILNHVAAGQKADLISCIWSTLINDTPDPSKCQLPLPEHNEQIKMCWLAFENYLPHSLSFCFFIRLLSLDSKWYFTYSIYFFCEWPVAYKIVLVLLYIFVYSWHSHQHFYSQSFPLTLISSQTISVKCLPPRSISRQHLAFPSPPSSSPLSIFISHQI